jgi:hypothetical protein
MGCCRELLGQLPLEVPAHGRRVVHAQYQVRQPSAFSHTVPIFYDDGALKQLEVVIESEGLGASAPKQ